MAQYTGADAGFLQGKLSEWLLITWRSALTLSLPRVVKFKFLLQPHQRYTSHCMNNLTFIAASILRLKIFVLPILTTSLLLFPLKRLGECAF